MYPRFPSSAKTTNSGEEASWGSGGEDPEADFGHVVFGMPARHPNGAVERAGRHKGLELMAGFWLRM